MRLSSFDCELSDVISSAYPCLSFHLGVRLPCPDYIAESVDEFLTEIGTEADAGEDIHLGFTFSFVSALSRRPFPVPRRSRGTAGEKTRIKG